MNPWGELVLGSLLWTVVISGLVYVVHDCAVDGDGGPALPGYTEDACAGCCATGCVEILTAEFQES